MQQGGDLGQVETGMSHPEPLDAEPRLTSQLQPSSSDGCRLLAWPGPIKEKEGESLLEVSLLFL